MFLYEPPSPDRKVKVVQGRSPGRGADGVVKHLAKGSIPINPKTLREIKIELADGLSTLRRRVIIEKVKSDPGLFAYCARNLRRYQQDQNAGINPIRTLENLADSEFINLFDIHEAEASLYHFGDMGKQQALRLQHTLLATQSAEALSPKFDLPPELAFVTAFFMQLGVDLIAWNYPETYVQAMLNHRKNNLDLETELERLLGISPLEVALRLANEWGIEATVKDSLTPEIVNKNNRADDGVVEESTLERSKRALREVCEISSLFAKTKDSYNYPNIAAAWQGKQETLQALGAIEVLTTVESKVSEVLIGYSEIVKTVISLPLAKAKLERDSKEVQSGLTRGPDQNNTYFKRCPPKLRTLIEDIYKSIIPNQASPIAIRRIAEDLVSALGFVRGCLYLRNKRDTALTPALRFGSEPLSAYNSLLKENAKELPAIVFSNSPFRSQGVGVVGGSVAYIAGPLENESHPGVIYLEVAEPEANNPEFDAILHFHLLRMALNDSFGE